MLQPISVPFFSAFCIERLGNIMECSVDHISAFDNTVNFGNGHRSYC